MGAATGAAMGTVRAILGFSEAGFGVVAGADSRLFLALAAWMTCRCWGHGDNVKWRCVAAMVMTGCVCSA